MTLSPALNIRFIETYYTDENVKGQALDTILAFVEGKKEYDPKVIEEAIWTSKVAIRQFNKMPFPIQKKIFLVMDAVTNNPLDAISEEFFKCHEVEKRLQNLPKALVSDGENIDIEIVAAKFSVLHYADMNSAVQKTLRKINELIPFGEKHKSVSPDNLKQLKAIFLRLPLKMSCKDLLEETPPFKVVEEGEPRSASPHPPPLQKDIGDEIISAFKSLGKMFSDKRNEDRLTESVFFQVTPQFPNEIEAKIMAETDEEKLIREKQIQKIKDHLEKIIRAYSPFKNIDPCISEHIDQKLSTHLPYVIERLFFKEPRGLEPRDKTVISAILQKAGEFTSHLSQAVNPKGDSHLVVKRLASFKKCDPKDLPLKLYTSIEEMVIQAYQPKNNPFPSIPTPAEGFTISLISAVLYLAAEDIFCKKNLLKILDRIFQGPIDLDNFEKRRPSSSTFPVNDLKFSREVGTFVVKMIVPILHLVETGFLIGAFEKFMLDPEMIGEKAVQAILRILNSECGMRPLLIMSHICVAGNERTFGDLKDPIEDEVKKKITEFIQQMVKTQISEKSEMFSTWTEETLNVYIKGEIDTVWSLFKEPDFFKVILLYVIEGINAYSQP